MPTFALSGTSFFSANQPPVTYPVTAGGTQQLVAGRNYLTAGATLATLTVKLPPSPANGASVEIIPQVAVTTLTMQTFAGGAVSGAPTAAVAGTRINMQYLGGAWVWVK